MSHNEWMPTDQVSPSMFGMTQIQLDFYKSTSLLWSRQQERRDGIEDDRDERNSRTVKSSRRSSGIRGCSKALPGRLLASSRHSSRLLFAEVALVACLLVVGVKRARRFTGITL